MKRLTPSSSRWNVWQGKKVRKTKGEGKIMPSNTGKVLWMHSASRNSGAKKWVAVVAFALVSATCSAAEPAFKPSFDCESTEEKTEAGTLVCSDPDLSRANREILEIYDKAQAIAIDQEGFRKETEDVWQWMNNCHNPDCIARSYRKLKAQLEATIRSKGKNGSIKTEPIKPYEERERERKIEEAEREEERRKEEARRLEEYKKFRFGSCKAWDKLSFTGGWVAGTAHHHLRFSAKFPLFLKINKYFLKADEKTKRHFAGENPLLVHERGDEAECSGFGKIGPMPATLIGKHEDGFFVILARIQTNYGRSTCVLNVRPQDLRCNK
jgi:uncharacterized protein